MINTNSIWFEMKPQKPVNFLKNKSRKNSTEIIYSLSLLGNATTSDISKFILKENLISKYYTPKPSEIRAKRGSINDRLQSRSKNNIGLVDQGFIINTNTSNTKNNPPNYALTIKGCFLALGFHMTDPHLKQLIKTQSKHSLFFAYLHSIVKETSFSFTKKIFINPIRKLIEKGLIPLDDDFQLSFSTISDYCRQEFYDLIQKNFNKINIHYIESVYDLALHLEPDWYQEAVERYFTFGEQRQNYMNIYSTDSIGKNYDVMIYPKIIQAIISAHNKAIQ